MGHCSISVNRLVAGIGANVQKRNGSPTRTSKPIAEGRVVDLIRGYLQG